MTTWSYLIYDTPRTSRTAWPWPARAQLAERCPEAWARIGRRREFMTAQLGIRLKPEVLPLSNLAGYLPPYWLAPGLAMRKK